MSWQRPHGAQPDARPPAVLCDLEEGRGEQGRLLVKHSPWFPQLTSVLSIPAWDYWFLFLCPCGSLCSCPFHSSSPSVLLASSVQICFLERHT